MSRGVVFCFIIGKGFYASSFDSMVVCCVDMMFLSIRKQSWVKKRSRDCWDTMKWKMKDGLVFCYIVGKGFCTSLFDSMVVCCVDVMFQSIRKQSWVKKTVSRLLGHHEMEDE